MEVSLGDDEANEKMKTTVAIIGGGLSGLNCARVLEQAGIPFLLFEQADSLGGRVATDVIDGFQLDRGFQVLLTAYPEAGRALDYEQLELQSFYPGSIVRVGQTNYTVTDPFWRPWRSLGGLFAPVGNLSDKLNLLRLRNQLATIPPDALYDSPDQPTRDYFVTEGFSRSLRERFLEPFFRGVHLDPELATSANLTKFIFQMFSQAATAIPSKGMGAIPSQLATRLPQETVYLESPIQAIKDKLLVMNSGETVQAEFIVVATNPSNTGRLINCSTKTTFREATTFYFNAPESPLDIPALMLNGDQSGPVNHLCVPSDIAASYAPKGRSLVSATALNVGKPDLLSDVRKHLKQWFGSGVDHWDNIATYEIREALPVMQSTPRSRRKGFIEAAPTTLICGDHVSDTCINGALRSGRLAAQAITAKLQ